MDTQVSPDSSMTIYDDEVFQMACEQFRVIADYLNIDKDDREWATYPKRAVAVTLPVHMDDGSTKAFQGYRVQHHIALGPTKGGTRFAPSLSMGETAALAMWMSWKCALAQLPIGGAEGRREATGRGAVYLIERAMSMLKMDPEKCTAIVQGFGNVGSVAALS